MLDNLNVQSILSDILEVTKSVVSDIIEKEAQTIDEKAIWPKNGIRALQKAGLGGLVIPAEYGGLGHGIYSMVRVCEEIGKSCPSTSISFGMHLTASGVLSAKATTYHVEEFLKPIAKGTHLTTLALSEPGTGAEFYFPQCELKSKSSDTFTINGTKSFVTNGGYADSYVVSTQSTASNQVGQFNMLAVTQDTKGLEWGPKWEGFGMRGNQSRTVELKNITVPAKNLLGSEGDQVWYVFHVVAPYFLAGMAGGYLGLATRAYEIVKDHFKERTFKHSEVNLARRLIPQERLAEMWGKIESTRQFIYWAAKEYDSAGPLALPSIIMTKVKAAECAVEITNEALTRTGGIAYRDNSILCRLLRDARAAHIMAPTTDYLKVWAGRALLDLPVLGD